MGNDIRALAELREIKTQQVVNTEIIDMSTTTNKVGERVDITINPDGSMLCVKKEGSKIINTTEVTYPDSNTIVKITTINGTTVTTN